LTTEKTTMTTTQCTCTGCAVQQGTHQPAEALHQQIDEPQAEAMRLADECDESATHWVHEIDTRFKAAKMLRAQQARIAELEASESRTIAQRDHCEEVIDRMADAVLGKDRPEWSSAYDFMDAAQEVDDRIAELEAQLDAIGAGGVEPLRKPAAAPQAVQAAVPEAIEQMAVDRYKVVPSHESMFHRWAVVADNGTQQLYIGREVECLNMARKFAGAFLDGAFVAMQNTTTAHPAEGVPPQASEWDGKLPERLQSVLNALRLELPAAVVNDVEFEVRSHYEAMHTSLSTSRRMYGAARDRLEAIDAAQPDPFAASQPAAQGMDAGKLLAEKHTGMKVDYRGLLGQVQREIERSAPGHAEMLRQLQGHLQELGQRWYAGDTAVVDELLQLYCVERQARADLAAQAKQGDAA